MRYEEPYIQKPKRPRNRRRRSFGGWLLESCLRVLALILALALVAAGVLYALPVSLFAVEPEGANLSLTDGLPAAPANILLLGLDATHENTRRSDSVIIASVNYGQVSLTSVLRDTVMDIPGHGPDKLNAAYAHGGAELVMRTLNHNLKLNIMHYVAVDYAALVQVVDALGGVDLAISQAEADKINQLISANRQRLTDLGFSASDLAYGGDSTHLTGIQALAYARIRKLDSDFMRAGRQRALLAALLKRLKASLWNPVRLVRLARALFRSAQTNMSPVQLLSLGEKALAAPAPRQLRLPVDGSYTDDGSALTITDLQKNIGEFQLFVYGGERE